jgi:hypothetical protein
MVLTLIRADSIVIASQFVHSFRTNSTEPLFHSNNDNEQSAHHSKLVKPVSKFE